MTAEQDHKVEDKPHHTARERAQAMAGEAVHKTEFILSRCFGLFRNPDVEWDQIRREETNIPSILIGYVAPLAAITPICGFIGTYAFGVEGVRPPISDALVGVGVNFLVSVLIVALLGVLINVVAENFDGDRDELAAQKVAAYALTPTFLSGVAWIWPPLAWISLLAMAGSFYLVFRGLPIVMRAPEDRAMGYAATVVVAALVAFILMLAITGCVTGGF
jgi:hypothetical protein